MAGKLTCKGKGWLCITYQLDEKDFCENCFQLDFIEKTKAYYNICEIVKMAKKNKETPEITLGKIETIINQYDKLQNDYINQNIH